MLRGVDVFEGLDCSIMLLLVGKEILIRGQVIIYEQKIGCKVGSRM